MDQILQKIYITVCKENVQKTSVGTWVVNQVLKHMGGPQDHLEE